MCLFSPFHLWPWSQRAGKWPRGWQQRGKVWKLGNFPWMTRHLLFSGMWHNCHHETSSNVKILKLGKKKERNSTRADLGLEGLLACSNTPVMQPSCTYFLCATSVPHTIILGEKVLHLKFTPGILVVSFLYLLIEQIFTKCPLLAEHCLTCQVCDQQDIQSVP